MIDILKSVTAAAAQAEAERIEYLSSLAEAAKGEHEPLLRAHMGAVALHWALMLVLIAGTKAGRPIVLTTDYNGVILRCGERSARVTHAWTNDSVEISLLGGSRRVDRETRWVPCALDPGAIHAEAAEQATRIGRHLMGLDE